MQTRQEQVDTAIRLEYFTVGCNILESIVAVSLGGIANSVALIGFGLDSFVETFSGLFINAENIGNIRQTRYDKLVRPQRHPDGRWTLDAWAPLEGRTVNGGVRVGF